MDDGEIERILRHQRGVISRRQVVAGGLGDPAIARLLRRRSWARVHDGVYVNHTGPITWEQRAWAAVLAVWPAALGGASALRAHGLTLSSRFEEQSLDVVVEESRRVRPPRSVRIQRLKDFDDHVLFNLSPPRVRLEHAVLTVASRARTVDAAVAVIGDACQSGKTTAERLVWCLGKLVRLPRRALLLEVLGDVRDGALSALEHRYLTRVERAHGLPRGLRQQRSDNEAGITFRDVEYLDHGVAVELDGRLGHEWSSDRWVDLDRDLASALEGVHTVRVGWKQILEECRLASAMARILRARGWTGAPRRCGADCLLDTGASPSSDEGDAPPSPAA